MIKLSLPSLPPSSNNAYVNLPRGGRMLSQKGRSYKIETAAHLQRYFRREMLFFRKNKPYMLAVRFFFPDVENKGWPTKAENRYKILDGSNRLKLVEDALKDAGGVDDSQTLKGFWEKLRGDERTDIWVWSLEEEETPFDEQLRAL